MKNRNILFFSLLELKIEKIQLFNKFFYFLIIKGK
jgi:hypothetical protein